MLHFVPLKRSFWHCPKRTKKLALLLSRLRSSIFNSSKTQIGLPAERDKRAIAPSLSTPAAPYGYPACVTNAQGLMHVGLKHEKTQSCRRIAVPGRQRDAALIFCFVLHQGKMNWSEAELKIGVSQIQAGRRVKKNRTLKPNY